MKLSIVTINYNNAEGLRKTLASVASQTYADIEHIIVDGGSTDGSVEIIRQYADNEAIRLEGYEAMRQEKNGKADDALPNRPIASSPYRLITSSPYSLITQSPVQRLSTMPKCSVYRTSARIAQAVIVLPLSPRAHPLLYRVPHACAIYRATLRA